MKKIEINGKIYDVVDPKEYEERIDLYNPKFTALQYGDTVMPIRSKNDNGPGYYPVNDMIFRVVDPQPEEAEIYSVNRVIDYSNPSSLADIIKNNQLIRDIRAEMITTPDDIFYLPIGENNTPEMKALKTAINNKQCCKNNYEDRFDQFQNDMRLLRGDSITLAKLIAICTAFDINAELILSDKPDSPNPMGNDISINLTEGRNGK